MNFTRNTGSRWFRLTAGWCALWLYVGACSPLGLGMAALTGSLDPNHQLLIGASGRGGRLVLHHGSRCGLHHHGLAAHALTLFARPLGSTNPDHILQFCSADTLKGESQSSSQKPDTRCVFLLFLGGNLISDTPKVLASGIPLDASTRIHVTRLCLRSTVLLI